MTTSFEPFPKRTPSGVIPVRVKDPQPFFVAGIPSSSVRRLLLLTYHFPPSLETGALRWESMIRYAADWGWEVDVVTLPPAGLDAGSLSRLRRLPSGCRLYGAPVRASHLEQAEGVVRLLARGMKRAVKPAPRGADRPDAGPATAAPGVPAAYRVETVYRLPASLRQAVRAYCSWREFVIQRPWCREAWRLAYSLAQREKYDAIVTCGPPHLVHTVGAALSRRTGLPLAMDLRDPWSLQQVLPEFRASKLWYRLAGRHERQAVGQASVIALNTEPCRDAMRAKYPARAAAMVVATNGFDERESLPPADRGDGRFLMAYAGTLYLVLRAPAPVLPGSGAARPGVRPAA